MLAAAPIAAYLLLLSATSSEAQTGGGTTGGATEAPFCAPSERRVDSFSGNGSQLTPEFRITANQWRYVYEASPSPPDSSGNLEIQPLDDGGDPINIGSEFTAILGEEENQRSLNIEGPDSFSLNIVTSGTTINYAVTVC